MIHDIEIRSAPRWRVMSLMAGLSAACGLSFGLYVDQLMISAPMSAKGEN